jgi:hypothetical protein
MKNVVIRFRMWLLRKLSMGRPIVLNVAINGTVDFRGADEWGLISDCHVDGRCGHVALACKP